MATYEEPGIIGFMCTVLKELNITACTALLGYLLSWVLSIMAMVDKPLVDSWAAMFVFLLIIVAGFNPVATNSFQA